ncbi:MAG: hypothetical protein WBC71_14030 [Salaquimonas sp.]
MNTFKKSVIAIATIATLAIAATAPAQAGSKHWKNGLAAGVGVGVGLGIAGALFNGTRQRQSTVYVTQQPVCYNQTQQYYDQFGILRARTVQVCN